MTRNLEDVVAFGPEEAARRLGLGRTTIYQLIRTGQLRSIKVGRRRLISIHEIDRFLAP